MPVVEHEEDRERGYAVVQHNRVLQDDNWELAGDKSLRVYAKMGREDAQVRSMLNAMWLPIRRANWQLDPNGAPAEVVRLVAEDLRLQVLGDDPTAPTPRARGKVSWKKHLQQALLAQQFGHMFFEQVYEVRDGRERLRKLAPRLPGTISKINVAADGGLESIEQSGWVNDTRGARKVTIPVSHLVAYVFDPVDLSWRGSSVLRPAYKHWVLRDELLRLERMVLDRNGMGVPVYEGSELADDVDADLEYGRELAQQVRAGRTGGASIPARAKLTLVGVSGQLVSPREAIAYHDSMIARAVLAHFLNLEGKGGSYSLAETQSDLFIQSLQSTAEWIADTANQHIVEDMVSMAWPDYDGPCPRIIFDPIASKKELTAGDIANLANAGVLHMDKTLEEEVRRRYNLPAKRPIDEAKAENPSVGLPSAEELAKMADAFQKLVAAGVDPAAAAQQVGLEVAPVESPPEPNSENSATTGRGEA